MSKLINGCASGLAVAFLLCGGGAAVAGPYTSWNDFAVTTTVDENGNGLLTNTDGFVQTLPFALQNDPGPGGLANVLTYSLGNPPGLTAGDVLMQDGAFSPILDVVRFNATQTCTDGTTGCLVFYSDNVDGIDSLGDTPSPPGANYTNTITIPEIGDEANNGAIYTPVAGQPGFVAGSAGPVTYVLVSDGTFPTPEPASLGIFLLGLAGFGLARSRRRRQASQRRCRNPLTGRRLRAPFLRSQPARPRCARDAPRSEVPATGRVALHLATACLLSPEAAAIRRGFDGWRAVLRACLAVRLGNFGPGNAQAQDQERCQEAVWPHRHRQDQA